MSDVLNNIDFQVELEINNKKFRTLTPEDKAIFKEGKFNSLVSFPYNFKPILVEEVKFSNIVIYNFIGYATVNDYQRSKIEIAVFSVTQNLITKVYQGFIYNVLKSFEIDFDARIDIQPYPRTGKPGSKDFDFGLIGCTITPFLTLLIDNKPKAVLAEVVIQNNKSTSFPMIFLLDENGEIIIPSFNSDNTIVEDLEGAFVLYLALYTNQEKIDGLPSEYIYITTEYKVTEIDRKKYKILASRKGEFASYNFYIDVFNHKLPDITKISKNY